MRHMDNMQEGLTSNNNAKVNNYVHRNAEVVMGLMQSAVSVNLKKIIRDYRDECAFLKQENVKIKKTIKYTNINEL